MERHVNRSAYLNIAFYSAVVLSTISTYLNARENPTFTITPTALVYVLFIYVPYFIGSFGLLKRWYWSRNVMVILSALSFLNLFQYPFGSFMQFSVIVGVYTIWVLLQSETAKVFPEPGRS
ncbi:MAG: hypothetical protein AAF629_26730 [Chloroflexota bacterium]